MKKDDYVLLKPRCYIKGKFIGRRKCKNRILSIPCKVVKDYDGGFICLGPSVHYMTFKKQYDMRIDQFNKRKKGNSQNTA